jgi:hypothetical protein
MHDTLLRRCALFLLVAMTAGLVVGLLATGPWWVPPDEHLHAGDHSRFGHAVNVLATLPLLGAGLWGLLALRRCGWPAALTRPWVLCCISAMLMALASALYHVHPEDPDFIVSNIAAAGIFMYLLAGFLAERVHAVFGSWRVCLLVLGVVLAAGAFTAWGLRHEGRVDLRALLLMQMLPVLLIPAGALSLPGAHTERPTWGAVLGLYLLARACDLGDQTLLDLTGWIGGHALMHVGLALSLGALAFAAHRAGRARQRASRTEGSGDDSHFSTSLNTSG